MEFAYFDIRNYQKPLRNNNKEDDKKLIALFKLLSPEHLLKLPFVNDSNSLDKRFYTELLHIIGLSESKEGSKKLIGRNKEGERNSGAILEDAIIQLDSLDKINRLEKPAHFGDTKEERLFNVALELSITWINRILFLKLLEAQLISYHKDDTSYSFLNSKKIKSYDDLNNLFFQVLACQLDERNEDVKKAFEKVPYLNSSLFEPTDIEQLTIFISNLNDEKTIPVISSTVLKDEHGKKLPGRLTTLDYLFRFLDAYDFSGESGEDIQEDNKTLINASVLGLIFEKINGYKDGSYFTPGFITMYMCRETIRKAVVQKFNDYCLNHDFQDLKLDRIEEAFDLIPKHISRKKANEIVNSITICDPAVGSGHFLVSALNEIIAIKNDLKILEDKEGRSLSRYEITVENDELAITDEDGELFQYHPGNKESQRVQETLFHEKETIIENCLFGVDINPNSVKICRLRLWIELLKNAYYKTGETTLETLPNIDINIKCGNSLVSRFAIDADLKQALKKSKWTIESYKVAAATYQNAESKEEKREMERLISDIKKDFVSELSFRNKEAKDLVKYRGQVVKIASDINNRIAFGEKVSPKLYKDLEKATSNRDKAELGIKQIESNKIFENAFEWRFEFPEVLNDEGDFIGFDVVIGNPPYIRVQELKYQLIDYYKLSFEVALKRVDISIIFIELSRRLLKQNGYATYITSNQFLTTEYGAAVRKYLKDKYALIRILDFGDLPIFENALTYVSIFLFQNGLPKDFEYCRVNDIEEAKKEIYKTEIINISNLAYNNWILASVSNIQLIEKLKAIPGLSEVGKSWAGLFTGLDKILMFEKNEIIEHGFEEDIILPVIRANDCSKFYCKTPTKYVIYPYKYIEGRTILLEEHELQSQFPMAYKYLLNNKSKLLARKDSRKTFKNKDGWFALTRFGQKNIFNKIKIVSPGEVKGHKFCIDTSKAGFSCARVFAITISDDSLNLKYVLALLNSNVSKFFIQSIASLKAGGYYSYSSNVLNKIPIRKITIGEQEPFIVLVSRIEKAKEKGIDTTELENQIDQLVYQLYDLTEEEIAIVENGSK